MTQTQTPRPVALPVTAIVHAACGRWWTGVSRAHCPACCETFSVDSAAEKHRTGAFGEDRRCLPPAEVGLVPRQMPFGILWGWPGPDGDTAERLAELRGAA